MKKNILFIVILFGILFSISCSKDELENKNIYQQPPQKVFTETRSTQNIQLWSDETPVRPMMADNALLDELGAGYDITKTYPLVSPQNITHMVIDVDKLYAEDRSRITVKKQYTSQSDYSSFITSAEYTESKNHTFNFGMNVNAKFLKVLNFSVDASLNKIFKHSNTDINRTIYSEIELGITTKDLTLNTGNSTDLAEKYASKSFKFDAYNITPEKLIATYGGHVLTDYTLGGRAFAITKAETRNHESSENKSKKMSAAVKVTFKTILNKSKVGFNTNVFDSTAINIKENFSSFDMAISTYGGNPGYGITDFFNIEDPQAFNVDLKNWGLSVVDDRFAQIHSINKNGLTPIYEFIREDNLRKRVKNYLEYGTNKTFNEPRIDRFVMNDMVFTVLYTRLGNAVLFDTQDFIRQEDDGSHIISARPWWLRNSYPFTCRPFYSREDNSDGISINYYLEGDYPQEYCGTVSSNIFDNPEIGAKTDYDFRNIDTNSFHLCKIENDNTGMEYLTFKKGNRLYALGIYKDFIKTLYAIDIRNLSIKTLKDLTGYTVIAL